MIKFRIFLESKFEDVEYDPSFESYLTWLRNILEKINDYDKILLLVLHCVEDSYKNNNFNTYELSLGHINFVKRALGMPEFNGEHRRERSNLGTEEYAYIAASNLEEFYKFQKIRDAANAIFDAAASFHNSSRKLQEYINHARSLISPSSENLDFSQKETLKKLLDGGDLWAILNFVQNDLGKDILKIYQAKSIEQLIDKIGNFKDQFINNLRKTYVNF